METPQVLPSTRTVGPVPRVRSSVGVKPSSVPQAGGPVHVSLAGVQRDHHRQVEADLAAVVGDQPACLAVDLAGPGWRPEVCASLIAMRSDFAGPEAAR
jgi:hypothetical protein